MTVLFIGLVGGWPGFFFLPFLFSLSFFFLRHCMLSLTLVAKCFVFSPGTQLSGKCCTVGVERIFLVPMHYERGHLRHMPGPCVAVFSSLLKNSQEKKDISI